MNTLNGIKTFASLFLIRFHQLSRESGLSSLDMCFLLFADAKGGEPVSKSEIARCLGSSRSGVYKMIDKMDDLVNIRKHDDGRYRLQPTNKGTRMVEKIMKGL